MADVLGQSMWRDLLLLREMINAASRIREVIGDLAADGLGANLLRREAVLWNYTSELPRQVVDIGQASRRRCGHRG
ncbi:MAG TPA: hypothetical protein VF062_24925 [Candidatus Limnocylindrales bacterium]